MTTKSTPKSCSCNACKRGKGTAPGKQQLRAANRAYRHASKVVLAKAQPDDVDMDTAPRGPYVD